jgi:hypothetical protein
MYSFMSRAAAFSLGVKCDASSDMSVSSMAKASVLLNLRKASMRAKKRAYVV